MLSSQRSSQLFSYCFPAANPPLHPLLCGSEAGNPHTSVLRYQWDPCEALQAEGSRGRLSGWRKKGDAPPRALPVPFALMFLSAPGSQWMVTPATSAGCSSSASCFWFAFFSTLTGSAPSHPLVAPHSPFSAPSSECWGSPHRAAFKLRGNSTAEQRPFSQV